MKKILLIGCGHMGQALLNSWINSKEYNLTVVDSIKVKKLKKIYKNKKIDFLNSISKLNNIKIDFIILAIKPIDLKNVLEEISTIKIKSQPNLISIVAGKKIKDIEKKLPNINNIFRIMPNISASIGESMNCIIANKKVSAAKKNEVHKLFSFSGKSIFLKNEDQIDMATAISGSGPGFIFNLIDAMEKAAENLGFEKNVAKTLVHQTFKGSINMLLKNNFTAEELVKQVATKGGTTEAGLKIMKKNKIHQVFKNLSKASYKRARGKR